MSRFHGFVRNIAVTQGTKQRPTQQGTCGIMSVRVIVKLKLSVTRDGLKKNKIVGYNMSLLPRKLNRNGRGFIDGEVEFLAKPFYLYFYPAYLFVFCESRMGWNRNSGKLEIEIETGKPINHHLHF